MLALLLLIDHFKNIATLIEKKHTKSKLVENVALIYDYMKKTSFFNQNRFRLFYLVHEKTAL